MLCFPFLNFPHLTLFFLSGQLPSVKIDFLFDFLVDKNECSIYNFTRTKVLTARRMFQMAASTFIFVLIGVSVVTTKVMDLLFLLDQPSKRRKARYAR